VFKNLGCLPGEHHISVNPTVKSVIDALRKVPVAIQPKLKQILDNYEQMELLRNVINRLNGSVACSVSKNKTAFFVSV